MKICVYAISKNEEKFAEKWIKNMSEADEVIVLDSFSTDKTKEILEKYGAKVYQEEIKPWRFDKARNASLSHVPLDADICVCVDLDEVFEQGWRAKLESAWKIGTKQARYKYVWNHNDDGSEGVCFYSDKMHTRHDFAWINPVHEILRYTGQDKYDSVLVPDLCLHHYADITKPRSSYLPLLELSIQEDPTNDRNMHYLGREYMFYGKYNESIATLKKHLSMPNALWKDERSSSYRYIARCYKALNKKSLAIRYFKLACIEGVNLREPRLELAELYYSSKKYTDCLYVLLDLFKITNRNLTYISSPQCWSSYPHDLASICYYKLKDYSSALYHAEQALLLSPNDERIASNIRYFQYCLTKK